MEARNNLSFVKIYQKSVFVNGIKTIVGVNFASNTGGQHVKSKSELDLAPNPAYGNEVALPLTKYPSELPSAAPFIKWAGGKHSVIDQLALHFPEQVSRYCEPFLGGGAVFSAFHDRMEQSGDSNLVSVINLSELKTYIGQDWTDFISSKPILRASVIAFYQKQKLAPGIVVGRLQNEKIIFYNRIRNLKVKLGWSSESARP